MKTKQKLAVGQILLYKNKGQLVCVKESAEESCRTWSHTGNTGARGNNELFNELSNEDIVNIAFDKNDENSQFNLYMLKSYIVRREHILYSKNVNYLDLAIDVYNEIDEDFILNYNFSEDIINSSRLPIITIQEEA